MSKKKVSKKTTKKTPVSSSNSSAKNRLPVVHQKSTAISDPSSPLNIYIREIKKIALLTPKQEKELALKAYDKNDKEAVKKLVQANLRFVLKIAFEYSRYGAKILDLVQEGNVGLIKAVQEFNPHKDVRLTTYAVYWIKSYMRDYLLKNWSIVKIGTTVHQKKLFYRLKKEQERIEREGIRSTPKMIAMNLGVPEKDVKLMQGRMHKRDQSLATPARGKDNQSISTSILEDQIIDDSHVDLSDQLEKKEISALFSEALNKFQKELDDREIIILNERLLSDKPRGLSDIGDEFGVSKERTRQLEERIKKKLKEYLAANYPDLSMN